MSENSNIIDVAETDFNDQVIEASESKIIIVDFWINNLFKFYSRFL